MADAWSQHPAFSLFWDNHIKYTSYMMATKTQAIFTTQPTKKYKLHIVAKEWKVTTTTWGQTCRAAGWWWRTYLSDDVKRWSDFFIQKTSREKFRWAVMSARVKVKKTFAHTWDEIKYSLTRLNVYYDRENSFASCVSTIRKTFIISSIQYENCV